jgi:glycine/D-amino acid oxidase-like deaminating enzyme
MLRGDTQMAETVLAPGFKAEPWWWEAAPRRSADAAVHMPAKADVVIVGSGYTGLAAALTLARRGREVLVLDAQAPGYGASSRNHGYVGFAPLSAFTELERRHGLERTTRIFAECRAAFDTVTTLIETEQIGCHYRRCGRVYWAYTRAQFEAKVRQLDKMREHLGTEGYVLGPGETGRESCTDHYFGGVVFPGTGQCHPGLYVNGLIERVEAAGARVVGHTRVLGVDRDAGGFKVETARGPVAARNVVIASNGYIGAETAHFRRRVVPVTAHICATEPIDPARLERMFPTGRTFLDLRSSFHSWCMAPDAPRLLFLGQTGRPVYDDERIPRWLHAEMCEIYPDLADVGFTHYWNGRMGFSFDYLPHLGEHDGVHYALAMNGTGLPMGTHLGNKIALKLLGDPQGATAFDGLEMKTMALFNGRPWFMPAVAGALQWLGRRESRRAAAERRRA